MVKNKEGIFDGSQIREPIKDASFDDALNPAELFAWLSHKYVIAKFLGNCRSSQYQKVVDELMKNFGENGELMSVKIHFLWSYLDYSPENYGDFSEEYGERFHQDISDIEKRYQGRWDVNFLTDYCRCLKRHVEFAQPKRKSLKRPSIHE